MKIRKSNQPDRPLVANFTDTTLRRAILSKHQNDRRQAIKELFTMGNKRNFLTQPAGAFIVLAIVILGGTGVYAAANWFGGIVSVTSDRSIMTVDLSRCQGDNLPPGIDENTDRSSVKFKITGEPHISKEDLQRKLLANCEHQTISVFYREKYGITSSDVGVVKTINPQLQTVTVEIAFGGKTFDKTMLLTPYVAVYDKGRDAALSNVKAGDYIMIAFDLAKPNLLEGESPYDQEITVKGIFKTQYDLREVMKDGKSLYEAPNNIIPLEQYEEMQRKKL